jgi:hypothetical protein
VSLITYCRRQIFYIDRFFRGLKAKNMSEKDLKRTRKTLYHNVEKQPIFGYNTNIANTSNERMF